MGVRRGAQGDRHRLQVGLARIRVKLRGTLTLDDGHCFGREPHLKEGIGWQSRGFQIKNGCGGLDQPRQAAQERLRQLWKVLGPKRHLAQV